MPGPGFKPHSHERDRGEGRRPTGTEEAPAQEAAPSAERAGPSGPRSLLPRALGGLSRRKQARGSGALGGGPWLSRGTESPAAHPAPPEHCGDAQRAGREGCGRGPNFGRLGAGWRAARRLRPRARGSPAGRERAADLPRPGTEPAGASRGPPRRKCRSSFLRKGPAVMLLRICSSVCKERI